MRWRFLNLGAVFYIFMTNELEVDGERKRWLAVLARASGTELEASVARQQPMPTAQMVRPPEIGMVMLRGRVGGTGDAFNLGEATVTRCALRLAGALGVGYTLGRDRHKAELIALLDALLQDGGRRDRLLREVIEPLQRRQAGLRDAVSGAASSSRVEFFTMVRGDA
jgi:alpha-D-ribose 1-methylphosphonate 5-triphosphate synthase subunit PhnG